MASSSKIAKRVVRKVFKKKTLSLAIASASMSLAGNSATAQSDGLVLEEIIVTAQRREQVTQDIPYNISAVSGDEMRSQHIVNQADLMRSVAGVSLVDRGYHNAGTVNSIIIRGLNVDNSLNGDIVLNAVPTVSTYVDNTPLFANFVLKDIARAEVLRGPQGTLYGSGSVGGAVRYISNKPKYQTTEGSVDLSYGVTDGSSGDNMNIDALLNFPLTDAIAVRASLGRIDNDGVIDYMNAYQLNAQGEPLIAADDGSCVDPRAAPAAQVLQNGACYRNVEDADTVAIDYGKVAARFDVTDTLELLLTYQRQEDEIGSRRSVTLGDNNQPAGSANYFDYGEYDSGQVLLEPSSREVDLTSLDVEWDFGFASFTSNTSAYKHEGRGNSDNGGLWVSGGEADPGASRDWMAAFGYQGWPRPAQRAERGYRDEALIQEFRLVSNETRAQLDWLVGAFYMDQDQTVFQNSWNPGMNVFNEACIATGDPVCDNFWPRFYSGLTERDFEYRRDVTFQEKAVYGEVTYHFSERSRLTAGFRWFDNETVNDTLMGFPLVIGWTSSEVPRSTDQDSDTLFKLNYSWDITNTAMLYGTVSEGYRRGGANAIPSQENGDPFGEPNADSIRQYQQDTVKNYELGIKGKTDTFAYTISAFKVDWKNPQLNATSAFFGFYMAINGDEASTQGVEVEVDGILINNLRYRIGYTHVKAELDADFINPQFGSVIAEKGSKLPGTPEDVLSVSLSNAWSLGESMDLTAYVGGYYQSESENYINQASVLNQTFDGFWLWSGAITLEDGKWVASLYGKNLGNEAGVTGAFPSAYWSYDTGVFENWYGNGNRQYITQPRTIGVSLKYRF